MVQHLLLMVIVPPMLWMGAPVVPLLVGLPRSIRQITLAVTRTLIGRSLTRRLLHPAFGWITFALAFWVWHAPALYDLAVESDLWHHVEHACFLGSALLFWRPVILAWPAQLIWPRWTMVPYLGLAMFQSVPLAAILTFSDRVIYTRYSSVEDQALAGVIMWVPGSIPLLLPILRVIVELSSARVAIEGRHA
jgi:cytochrome c oxidase assembly factor CtaG